MDKTCNTWELSPSHWAGTGCDGFCIEQELSLKQQIVNLYLSTPIHLFKWQILVDPSINVHKFRL